MMTVITSQWSRGVQDYREPYRLTVILLLSVSVSIAFLITTFPKQPSSLWPVARRRSRTASCDWLTWISRQGQWIG